MMIPMNYNDNIPMEMWKENDKPATKILMKGKMALSDSELLSIIIGNDGSRMRSSLDASRLLLNQANGNLAEIAKLSVTELSKNCNLTVAQATRVITAFEIGRRRAAQKWHLK
jgi:DNA repair protein RadC